MSRVVSYNVRDAADLVAAATATTKWVPSFGARAVIFEWRATNANAPQNAGTPQEATNIEPLAAGGASWSGTPGNITSPLPAVATFALNGAGGLRSMVIAAGGMPFLANRAIRMSILGNATLTITGLSCTAYVIYDGDTDGLLPVGAIAV